MPKTTQDLLVLFVTEGEDWEPGIIQAALKRKGSPLTFMEGERGLRPGSMRNVLYRPCDAYEQAIAAALGISPAVIWPSRYRNKNPQIAAA